VLVVVLVVVDVDVDVDAAVAEVAVDPESLPEQPHSATATKSGIRRTLLSELTLR
jgi:hypothetical protein